MKMLLSTLIKSYRYLLHLYPHSYQEEFAEEMLLDFSDMATDASKMGKLSLIRFCLRELVDFPVNLLKIHLEKKPMNPVFHPGAARNILRIAFAFGLALALDNFAGIIAFLDRLPVWQFVDSLGWTEAYKDIQPVLLNLSGLVIGPIFAATVLLALFPEMRPIKRYLPAVAWAFALPAILVNLRSTVLKHMDFTFEDTIFAVASYIMIGLGFGVVASLISRERRKIFWLLSAGPLICFLTTWASNVLIFRLYLEHHFTFWSGVASVAMRNILIGMVIGLGLGLVLEFKKRDQLPSDFSSA
jgi:hypothetical protein